MEGRRKGGREGWREGGREGLDIGFSFNHIYSCLRVLAMRMDGREGGRRRWGGERERSGFFPAIFSLSLPCPFSSSFDCMSVCVCVVDQAKERMKQR
jgi:hypothetical protein